MRVRKLLLASAVASIMASPAAFAAPPSSSLGFGYTPPPGSDPMSTADSAYCSDANYTCSSQPITDTGFLQVQITDSAGNTYFQTIIDDPNSSFQTVSFVTTGSSNGGVAAQQSLNEGGLSDTTTIYTGSFRDTTSATESDVAIDQSVTSTATGLQFTADFAFTKNLGNSGNNVISLDQVVLEEFNDNNHGTHTYDGTSDTVYEFADRFALTQTQDGSGNILGETIDIDSGVRLNDVVHVTGSTTTVSSGGVAVDASNTPTSADALFVFNKRRGSEVAAANVGTATLGGTTVDWVLGDSISQTLIEQRVTAAGDFAFANITDLLDTSATDNDAPESGSNFSLSTNDASTLFTITAPTDPFL